MIDGMRMEWQKEERVVEKLFPIHNQTKIGACDDLLPVEKTKPIVASFHQKQAVPIRPLPTQKQSSKFYTDIRMAPHQATTFESMSNREIVAAIFYDRYCLTWYHMNSSQKYKMMGLNYKKFEQQLLSDKTLLDWSVWELWNEYKDTRLWNLGNQKGIHEESIRSALENREKDKNQEIEALFAKIAQQEKVKAEQELLQIYREKRVKKGTFIQIDYELLKRFSKDHEIICGEFLQNYDQALETSQLQNYEQQDIHYELDNQTRGYLSYKNIDYKEFENFIGTNLQQAYHAQTCKIFKDAARLQSKIFHDSDLLTGACHIGVAAHEANKQERTAATGALCIIGSKLVKYTAESIEITQRYGLAVAEGVIESATDFFHMLANPFETLCGIGKMIYFVLDTLALEETAADFSHDPKIVALAQQRRAEISNGLHLLVEHVQNMDGPARVKAITKFGADFVIPGKITSACARLLGGVCVQARELRKIENVMSILWEDLRAEQAFEFAAQGAGKIVHEEGAFTEILTEFFEAENQLSKASQIPRSLKTIVNEIRNVHNGVIPFDRIDLYEEVNLILKEIMAKINKPISKSVRQKYISRFIDNKNVQMNWEHVTSCGFNLNKRNNKGFFEILLEINHESGVCALLQEAGIVKIKKMEKLPNGCCKYLLENSFNGKIFEKTEFPLGWSFEKIMESGWNIYEKSSLAFDIDRDGKISKVASIDNVLIKIIATNHATDCNIITIYPC